MKNFLIILFLFLGLTSCTNKVVDIKSPCVSSEDGPCGPKKPINDWWIKDNKKHHLNSLS